MEISTVSIDLLFETSWEVCNKIGGIYTVLSTKAKTLQKLYKDKVIFIGPDVWSEENPSPYFIETPSVLGAWKDKAVLPAGVSVRTGRWDVPGKPIVVLIKFDGMYSVKDEYYGEMWNRFGVDSLSAYGDYDECCAFSLVAGAVIESICLFNKVSAQSRKNAIAHFDEWQTGMGLLYVKWKVPQVATVFTTHATSIGRSICGNGKPLYGNLKEYNGDQLARELNMQSKHSLEKAAAHSADCFTTVSEVTAIECEQLLELRPQVVTPNGFERNFVPARTKFASVRHAARTKLIDVASALTGKKYPSNTMLIATSGRCEYRNKGLDVFLDSMANLNARGPKRPCIAFVMVPAWMKEAREDLKKALNSNINQRLDDPVITHWLNNAGNDPVLSRIHGINFTNDKNSRVDVIYVPCYLNGNDGIFNMEYYDLLIGMDATVFPSYYEPWGYTPLESVAFGVPTVTTSLSGFGQWILSTTDNLFYSCGVTVVGRGDYNYPQVVDNIARALDYLNDSDDDELCKITDSAIKTAGRAAWNYFITCYVEAYEVALASRNNRVKSKK